VTRRPTVPLVRLPDAAAARLSEFGAPKAALETTLYLALANQPDLLLGWVDLAWRLRQLAVTPRRLRELMIVRGAQMSRCEYELLHHQAMARAAGVSDAELDALPEWRESDHFTEKERVALDLMEEMIVGSVSDPILERLQDHFDPKERVELILTAGMYAMVPRVVDALRLPLPEQSA
jgi:AhpD family alkylhydroperoxidase